MHHAIVITPSGANENTVRRYVDELINSQRLDIVPAD